MTKGAVTDLDVLADQAAYLWRTRTRTVTREMCVDDETWRRVRAGRRQFSVLVRNAVRSGDFRQAMMLFGNESDAGFRFLEMALPAIPVGDRGAIVADAWMHGCFGEHAWGPRRRRVRGISLAIRTIALLRSVPDLRPVDWPDETTVFRGVRALDETQARLFGFAPSWTRDRSVAAWFACRGGVNAADAWVLEASVGRDAVLAFFDDRNEAEVIIDTSRLRTVAATRLTDADRQAVEARRLHLAEVAAQAGM